MVDAPNPAATNRRPALFVLLGLAGFVLIAFVALRARLTEPNHALLRPITQQASPPTDPGPARPVSPSFDVVRVSPTGDTVMAGRAAPGAEIVLHQGDHEIGRTHADNRGEWVFLPSEPLAPGARELTLRERTTDGQEIASDSSVLLVVPDHSPAVGLATGLLPAAPVVVLSGSSAAPRVLQGVAGMDSKSAHGKLGLNAVEYDDHGQMRFAGAAPPGSRVRVLVDSAPIGDATADPTGRWTLLPTRTVPAGKHVLQLQRIGPNGHVVERVDLPFQRQILTAQDLDNGHIVVQPGYSLWLLARRAYGGGTRYTVIYQANKERIQNPNLIYPGQILAMPNGETPTKIP